jgi:hypothetical protein
MAPPTLRVVAPKPKMTIYFALLIIALVAMLFACLFLYLEIRRFGGFGAVSGRVSSLDDVWPDSGAGGTSLCLKTISRRGARQQAPGCAVS